MNPINSVYHNANLISTGRLRWMRITFITLHSKEKLYSTSKIAWLGTHCSVLHICVSSFFIWKSNHASAVIWLKYCRYSVKPSINQMMHRVTFRFREIRFCKIGLPAQQHTWTSNLFIFTSKNNWRLNSKIDIFSTILLHQQSNL